MGSNQPSCQKASQSGKIIMGTQALPSISLFPPRSMQDTCFPAALNRHGVTEWKRGPHTLPRLLYEWCIIYGGWSNRVGRAFPSLVNWKLLVFYPVTLARATGYSSQYESIVTRRIRYNTKSVWTGNRARDRNTNDTIWTNKAKRYLWFEKPSMICSGKVFTENFPH